MFCYGWTVYPRRVAGDRSLERKELFIVTAVGPAQFSEHWVRLAGGHTEQWSSVARCRVCITLSAERLPPARYRAFLLSLRPRPASASCVNCRLPLRTALERSLCRLSVADSVWRTRSPAGIGREWPALVRYLDLDGGCGAGPRLSIAAP